MSAEVEFVSLRQEMLQCETYIVNMTTFVMTVTGASLAAAFQYRNPIAALFPLFVLYLGNVVVFNNVQTIALIGAYFQIFWEDEHREFRWETRQAERRSIMETKAEKNKREKRSASWEEWMGPLAQRMFKYTGYLCIFVYIYVSLAILRDPQPTDLLLSIPLPYFDWLIFILFFVLALGIWVFQWRHIRRLTDPIHGVDSMMEQSRTIWKQIQDNETAEQTSGGQLNMASRKSANRATSPAQHSVHPTGGSRRAKKE